MAPGGVRRLPAHERVGEGECGDRGVGLRAVDQGEPLLGLERHRREAGAGERLAAGQAARRVLGLALACEDEREVGQRREVAARAHAPLLRHHRVHAGGEHREQQLGERGPRARVAAGEHVGAQEHHRPHLARRERRPDAGRVAPHEVALQVAQPRRRVATSDSLPNPVVTP
jgi:hypothetical protein